MGGDGGSIPSRIDMVRTSGYVFTRNIGGMGYLPNTQSKIADEHLSSNQIKELRWTICAISQEPLNTPIVACKIGLLYNKEAVIKYILSKKTKQSFEHIKSLKDVKDVNFTIDKETRKFICPILRTEFSGAIRAVLIWKCGCCISEKAFKEFMGNYSKTLVSNERECPNCNAIFHYNQQSFSSSHSTNAFNGVVKLVPDLNEEGLLRTKLLNITERSKN